MTEPEKIEADALRLGVTMTEVLRGADIAYSTWWRWKQGGTSPSRRALFAVMAELNKMQKTSIKRKTK
jgi:hypothetical protein